MFQASSFSINSELHYHKPAQTKWQSPKPPSNRPTGFWQLRICQTLADSCEIAQGFQAMLHNPSQNPFPKISHAPQTKPWFGIGSIYFEASYGGLLMLLTSSHGCVFPSQKLGPGGLLWTCHVGDRKGQGSASQLKALLHMWMRWMRSKSEGQIYWSNRYQTHVDPNHES